MEVKPNSLDCFFRGKLINSFFNTLKNYFSESSIMSYIGLFVEHSTLYEHSLENKCVI